MSVDWKHWTISDVISLLLLLAALITGGIHLSGKIDTLSKQHEEAFRALKENGRLIQEIRDTQKDVVRVLTDFPPHRHVGNQIVYPNKLPEVVNKNNNNDPR